MVSILFSYFKLNNVISINSALVLIMNIIRREADRNIYHNQSMIMNQATDHPITTSVSVHKPQPQPQQGDDDDDGNKLKKEEENVPQFHNENQVQKPSDHTTKAAKVMNNQPEIISSESAIIELTIEHMPLLIEILQSPADIISHENIALPMLGGIRLKIVN